MSRAGTAQPPDHPTARRSLSGAHPLATIAMTKQIATLPDWPTGWFDTNINRAVREIPTLSPTYLKEYIEHEAVPAREGGFTFTGKTLPDCNVELGQMFFACQVLWRITGCRTCPDYLEIHATSVASLSDLLELLPS